MLQHHPPLWITLSPIRIYEPEFTIAVCSPIIRRTGHFGTVVRDEPSHTRKQIAVVLNIVRMLASYPAIKRGEDNEDEDVDGGYEHGETSRP
jgi:hypothetical protein